MQTININWYLSVIRDNLNPPFKTYIKQINNIIDEVNHKGMFEIKCNRAAIAVTSAIKKITK